MTCAFLEEVENKSLACLEKLGLAWWLIVVTEKPKCTYYFGPFLTPKNAKISLKGYVEDLEGENAEILSYSITQGYPPVEDTILIDE